MNDKMNRRDVLAAGLASAAVATTGLPAPAYAAGKLPANIIDGQAHIWKPGGPTPSPTGRQPPLSAEELLSVMDAGGVKRLTIVTPSWSPDQNGYPLEAAQKYPDRIRVFGLYFDWNKPANPEQIQNWMKPQGMVGIRMFLGSEPGTKWLTGTDSDWIWPILEKQNIPLMISAANSVPTLSKIAEKHPGLKMCLDSFGVPGLPGDMAKSFGNFGSVLAMAKYPNVIVKCASVPFLSGEPYPYKNIQPYVKQAFDAFGPERLIFASDATLLKGSSDADDTQWKANYKSGVNFWTELDWLSDADRTKIMSTNLAKWINWPWPA